MRKELAGRPLTVEDVPRLKYAEAVINESMRLHPPAYVLGREAIRDTTVGGHHVPKGWTVYIGSGCPRSGRGTGMSGGPAGGGISGGGTGLMSGGG